MTDYETVSCIGCLTVISISDFYPVITFRFFFWVWSLFAFWHPKLYPLADMDISLFWVLDAASIFFYDVELACDRAFTCSIVWDFRVFA